MDTLKLLAMYWSIMLACYFIASRLRQRAESFGFLNRILTFFIILLVFIMGLQMGADEEVTSSLGTIGLQAVIMTVLAVGGSMLFVFFWTQNLPPGPVRCSGRYVGTELHF